MAKNTVSGIHILNQCINMAWTIACFLPVIVYWFSVGMLSWLYVFIITSLLSVLLPARIYRLSVRPAFYERLGVRTIRRFVQHGDLINKAFRKANPAYKIIQHKTDMVKYLHTIAMYERFHVACFIFFCCTMVHAITQQRIAMPAILVVSNIIYNICPVLLQQYNRARVKRIGG